MATVPLFPFYCLLLAAGVQGAVTWSATPFNPPSVPLAVRTPYLSTWMPQGSGTALNEGWPQFWAGQITGWAGLLKVDGQPYSFLGDPVIAPSFTKATQTSLHFTSSQSIFVLTAGSVNLTTTFLSPVEPNNITRQSLPFSYLSLTVASTDGKAHSVQLYTDISAEWASGDPSLTVNWTTTAADDHVIHQVQLQNQTIYGESSDHAQYGSVYYASKSVSGGTTTYQTGADVDVRATFVINGTLGNTTDTAFRAVNDKWPVFAIAHDLGTISAATTPVVIAIGHVRDPAVEYIVANDVLSDRHMYFLSQYSSVSDALTEFLGDYDDALIRADAFDHNVSSDASSISSDYEDVVALSIRQAFATIEFTVSKDVDGSYNTSDILIFMKEISSDGNVNTVDVIFPTWPLFLYTNPTIGKYLLDSLFQYQATGQYPNKYSMHDLGSAYPKAIGHNDGKDETMPVEESGNMIVMALSYANKTGDTSQLKQYGSLLDQWAQFLVADSLIPALQLSTDDFAGSLANQTNLAIKGIVGIQAMAKIHEILGNSAQSSNYSSIASSYISQWQTLAIASGGDHLTLSYGNSSSWGLAYNLYGDKLLGLNLFPDSIYDMETSWYKNVAYSYGVPLDTRHTYTISNWEIWTAAFMTDTAVRDTLISSVRNYVAAGTSSAPFGDWYDTVSGKAETFRARPIVGGHLALLIIPSAAISNSTSAVSSSTTVSESTTTSSLPTTASDSTSSATVSPTSPSDNSATVQYVMRSQLSILITFTLWLLSAGL